MLDQNIMSRNLGAEDFYNAKNDAPGTYDFSTFVAAGVVSYYYDNSRDKFTNKKAWVDGKESIVRVLVDNDLRAQEIDVIFDLVYADRKRQQALFMEDAK